MLGAALAALDPALVVRRVNAGEPVPVTLEEETLDLLPEEVLVQSQPAAGLVVAAEKEVTVAVDTVITPELAQEGYARELVRRIQQLRKDAGLAISDRIILYLSDSPLTAGLLAAYGDYVKDETLTVELVRNGVPSELPQASFALGDSAVTVALRKR